VSSVGLRWRWLRFGTAVVTLAEVAGFGDAWECRSDVAGLTAGVSYLGEEAEN
jgi:hypothetical protein